MTIIVLLADIVLSLIVVVNKRPGKIHEEEAICYLDLPQITLKRQQSSAECGIKTDGVG